MTLELNTNHSVTIMPKFDKLNNTIIDYIITDKIFRYLFFNPIVIVDKENRVIKFKSRYPNSLDSVVRVCS